MKHLKQNYPITVSFAIITSTFTAKMGFISLVKKPISNLISFDVKTSYQNHQGMNLIRRHFQDKRFPVQKIEILN